MEILPIKAERFFSRNDMDMAEALLSPTQRSPLGKSPSLSPRDFEVANDAETETGGMNPQMYT